MAKRKFGLQKLISSGPWQHKRRCHRGPGPERFIVPAHGTTKEVNKHQQPWLPSAVSPINHKPIPLKTSIYPWPQRLVPEVFWWKGRGESLCVSVCVCLYLNCSHTVQNFCWLNSYLSCSMAEYPIQQIKICPVSNPPNHAIHTFTETLRFKDPWGMDIL